MTPEQLDEIEKLARTGEPEDDGGGDTAAFLRECHILPLVKAVREAWQERDAAKEDAKTQGAMHHRYYWRFMACAEAAGMDEQLNAEKIAKIEKERDAARAEVERLREVVRKVHAMTGSGVDWATFPKEAATALREIHKLTKENR